MMVLPPAEDVINKHRYMTTGKVVFSVLAVLIPIVIVQSFGFAYALGVAYTNLKTAITDNSRQDVDIKDIRRELSVAVDKVTTDQQIKLDKVEKNINDKLNQQNLFINQQLNDVKQQIRDNRITITPE